MTTYRFPHRVLPQIEGIRAYVVNTYNPGNFDIDLNLSPELAHRYSNSNNGQYIYEEANGKKIKSTFHRCRLHNIRISKSRQPRITRRERNRVMGSQSYSSLRETEKVPRTNTRSHDGLQQLNNVAVDFDTEELPQVSLQQLASSSNDEVMAASSSEAVVVPDEICDDVCDDPYKILYLDMQNDHDEYRRAIQYVQQFISLSNGWVICNIKDIDMYQHILVDIYDPITKNSLSEQLVNNFPYVCHLYQ